MTFGQLQTLVYSWVDDPNGTYFTPPQVQQFINNAQQECNKQLTQMEDTYYKKCAQTALVTNQECYLLPSDFEKINHAEVILGGTPPTEQKAVITHSTQGEADIVNYTAGQPVTFFLEKNCLIMRPPPDQPYVFRMHYSYRVADMIFQGEVPDVPIEYHEYLAVLAARDCYLKDQRDASQFMAKIAEYKELMKQSATDRAIDKPRGIVETWDDGFSTLF